MVRGSVFAVTAATVILAPSLVAQGKPKEKEEAETAIPETAWPPAGMCRVWLRDVPERQQPAPTDCATALRTRPRDAKLLLGEPTQDARQALPLYAPATMNARATSDDLFGRRGVRSMNANGTSDRFGRPGTMTPAEAMRAAEAALVRAQGGTGTTSAQGTAAAKADPPKPVVKPPEPPQR